ncbi:MAG: FAD-dependent monooxygenase [Gammaproteobacteria bacterium]|nr:FAD-dependent monooxygenase [Gammaproteobacteria bacterium]
MIAILGGGVAGVSSAIALKQAGFEVCVYERSMAPSNIGAGIVVWPNAAFVLERIGVLEDIKAVSGYPRQMRRLSSSGEDLGAISIELINQTMGYPSMSILRRDFQAILIAKLEALGVDIRYGHAVTNIETSDRARAQVSFQNGTTIEADIVIGADGRMASYARQYVKQDNKPVYQGFVNWIGVFESSEDVFEDISVADYWGIGERFGIVPITKNKAYWAGGVASDELGQRKPSEYKSDLRVIFSNWPTTVCKMIDETPTASINKIYVHDHDPMSVWHRNNLLVIGDAAHAPLPTSGQGACQALEDAWHLSQCLSENAGDLQNAFSEFTQLRYEKTSNIIMAARGFAASLFNRDKDYCHTRNENSKKTDFANVSRAMSRAWSSGLPLRIVS